MASPTPSSSLIPKEKNPFNFPVFQDHPEEFPPFRFVCELFYWKVFNKNDPYLNANYSIEELQDMDHEPYLTLPAPVYRDAKDRSLVPTLTKEETFVFHRLKEDYPDTRENDYAKAFLYDIIYANKRESNAHGSHLFNDRMEVTSFYYHTFLSDKSKHLFDEKQGLWVSDISYIKVWPPIPGASRNYDSWPFPFRFASETIYDDQEEERKSGKPLHPKTRYRVPDDITITCNMFAALDGPLRSLQLSLQKHSRPGPYATAFFYDIIIASAPIQFKEKVNSVKNKNSVHRGDNDDNDTDDLPSDDGSNPPIIATPDLSDSRISDIVSHYFNLFVDEDQQQLLHKKHPDAFPPPPQQQQHPSPPPIAHRRLSYATTAAPSSLSFCNSNEPNEKKINMDEDEDEDNEEIEIIYTGRTPLSLSPTNAILIPPATTTTSPSHSGPSELSRLSEPTASKRKASTLEENNDLSSPPTKETNENSSSPPPIKENDVLHPPIKENNENSSSHPPIKADLIDNDDDDDSIVPVAPSTSTTVPSSKKLKKVHRHNNTFITLSDIEDQDNNNSTNSVPTSPQSYRSSRMTLLEEEMDDMDPSTHRYTLDAMDAYFAWKLNWVYDQIKKMDHKDKQPPKNKDPHQTGIGINVSLPLNRGRQLFKANAINYLDSYFSSFAEAHISMSDIAFIQPALSSSLPYRNRRHVPALFIVHRGPEDKGDPYDDKDIIIGTAASYESAIKITVDAISTEFSESFTQEKRNQIMMDLVDNDSDIEDYNDPKAKVLADNAELSQDFNIQRNVIDHFCQEALSLMLVPEGDKTSPYVNEQGTAFYIEMHSYFA